MSLVKSVRKILRWFYLVDLQPEEIRNLLIDGVPLIDVRAPVEFSLGSIPGAINLPILNDHEREQVGTTYKQVGQSAAIDLGHKLVSGEVKKQRVALWREQIEKDPRTVIYCFRGGMRSHLAQQWLSEVGIQRPLIAGGYKAVRQVLIEIIEEMSAKKGKMLIVAGTTGSAKTHFLNEVKRLVPVINLEALANHRGSAFGSMGTPQPSQVDFENMLARELLLLEKNWEKSFPDQRILLEDESRLIGRRSIPDCFFDSMRSASVIWLDESLATRVDNIYKDYIIDTEIGSFKVGSDMSQAVALFDRYRESLIAIQKRLGGLKTQEILRDLELSRINFTEINQIELNKVWIQKLLEFYYDPLYLNSLDRRQVQIEFRGSRAACLSYLERGSRGGS